jgi:polysaccharide pyruvyl transferase WcaK-like protein
VTPVRWVLSGYYGERNAGDDAFQLVITRRLAQAGAERFLMNSPLVPQGVHGIPLRLSRRWRGIADRIESARIRRAFVHGAGLAIGGGSLFRTVSGIREHAQLAGAARSGSPRVALGVSLGPFQDDAAAGAARELLASFDFIGLRDAASVARADSLGLRHNAFLTGDLVPLLPRLVHELRPLPRAARHGLGIALCRGHVPEDELQHLASTAQRWLARHPAQRLFLVSFNAHPRKGDQDLHDRLATLIDRPRAVAQVRYADDPAAMWQAIAGLEGLIAMRLHAAVFAHGAAVPVLMLPYEEKGLEWARLVEAPADAVRRIWDVDVEAFEALASGASLIAAVPPAAMAERAEANFAWLVRP